MLASCQKDLGMQRNVLLAMHAEVASPLTFGLWQPTILLPTNWQHLSHELQRGSLLHELAHVKRLDTWLALWLQAVGAVFVFHPAVRWLRLRLECEREMLCDELALSCGVDARASRNDKLRLRFCQPNRTAALCDAGLAVRSGPDSQASNPTDDGGNHGPFAIEVSVDLACRRGNGSRFRCNRQPPLAGGG